MFQVGDRGGVCMWLRAPLTAICPLTLVHHGLTFLEGRAWLYLGHGRYKRLMVPSTRSQYFNVIGLLRCPSGSLVPSKGPRNCAKLCGIPRKPWLTASCPWPPGVGASPASPGAAWEPRRPETDLEPWLKLVFLA